MPQIRRGLRIEDDDEEVPKYEKQTLDANRKRTNFEKDMDDLLFGGGMKPAVRRQPKEEPKPEAKPQPPTQKPVQPTSQPSKPTQPPQKPIQHKPLQSKTNISSVRSIGLDSRVQAKQVNNYVEPEKPSVIEEVVQQPRQHEEPTIEPERIVQISGTVFNRPAYIRKLKKIAQDFNFSSENINNHSAMDVVRPFECDRSRMKKYSQYNFIDNEFPPNSYSLGYSLKNMVTEWKRHNEFVRSSVFGKYIDPNDINPGKLSSSQFLSTLSCLAESESNIKRLIEDQKVNSEGFYLVRLNINGVWRYIPVDNKLPFSEGEALGAQSFNDNQSDLWVALIEKAYAKAYGSYDIFNRPIVRENYLRDLTGAPVRKFLVTDNELPNVIRNAISAGQVVMAVPREQIKSLGLNPNNSFTVLNCKSNGGLEMRNSWGTIEQRPKIPLNKQGIFELSSNQTKQFISYVMIAYTNNSYNSTTIQSKHKNGFYSTYNFTVKNQSHGFLIVNQWDQKFFPQNAYQYSPMRLILQKRSQDDVIYVVGGFTTGKSLDVQVVLTPGEYQVFIAANWKSREFDYDLTYFGEEKFDFRRIYTNQFPNKITQCLTKLNLESGKRSALGNCDQYIQYHKDTNLVIVTANNTSAKDYLFNQDFTKVNFDNLLLLNARNNEENYENMTGEEIDEHKNHSLQNRRWSVSIPPHGQFTWVIAAGSEYNAENFRKWGFR